MKPTGERDALDLGDWVDRITGDPIPCEVAPAADKRLLVEALEAIAGMNQPGGSAQAVARAALDAVEQAKR